MEEEEEKRKEKKEGGEKGGGWRQKEGRGGREQQPLRSLGRVKQRHPARTGGSPGAIGSQGKLLKRQAPSSTGTKNQTLLGALLGKGVGEHEGQVQPGWAGESPDSPGRRRPPLLKAAFVQLSPERAPVSLTLDAPAYLSSSAAAQAGEKKKKKEAQLLS